MSGTLKLSCIQSIWEQKKIGQNISSLFPHPWYIYKNFMKWNMRATRHYCHIHVQYTCTCTSVGEHFSKLIFTFKKETNYKTILGLLLYYHIYTCRYMYMYQSHIFGTGTGTCTCIYM